MILQLPPASSQPNAVADQTIETRAIASRSGIKCAKEVVVRQKTSAFTAPVQCVLSHRKQAQKHYDEYGVSHFMN